MPGEASSVVFSAEDYRMLLGLDFMTFAQRVFHDLRPESAFEPHPYLEVLASRLEECRRGTIRRLIINVPPRHTKSILASVALPAGCSGMIRAWVSSVRATARTSPTHWPETAGSL